MTAEGSALLLVAATQVMLRGGIIFAGYLNLDSTTKDVLEPDGWFHTGDIGEILPDGSLKIIDRKKNIFKLSQGEYIAVEKVEAAFGKSDFVDTVSMMMEQLLQLGNIPPFFKLNDSSVVMDLP